VARACSVVVVGILLWITVHQPLAGRGEEWSRIQSDSIPVSAVEEVLVLEARPLGAGDAFGSVVEWVSTGQQRMGGVELPQVVMHSDCERRVFLASERRLLVPSWHHWQKLGGNYELHRQSG
jgi:hypothetical protein